MESLIPQQHNEPLLADEIAQLETQLQQLENQVYAFEVEIRTRLQSEIQQVQELTEVYKQFKRDKKSKRDEQRRRGKNYQQPIGLKKINPYAHSARAEQKQAQQQNIKQLYKASIKQIHPDKFAQASESENQKATEMTVRLNELYRKGDLQNLQAFHDYLTGELTAEENPYTEDEQLNTEELDAVLLRQRKVELLQDIQKIKQSHVYHVLTTYDVPLNFIGELRIEFQDKIQKLLKRTRKARK